MLGFARRWMLEALEGALDVTWHGYVAGAGGIVPVEGEAAISGAAPIAADSVVLLEGREDMVGVVLGGVSDTKIIDNEAEHDVASFVMPQSGRERQRFIAVGGEVLDELVVGESSGLGQSVHTVSNFDLNVAFVDERPEVLFVDDDVGNHVDRNTYVFVLLHWRPQVKVLDIGG